MCGIVGYLGRGGAGPRVLQGLALLEYRGYDSCGLSLGTADGILTVKDLGGAAQALAAGRFAGLPDAPIALGHTRWATHGGVTLANAHPHLSYDGEVAVVHNGVISNYLSLRRMLQAEGIVFLSETDSEVVPHLIAREFARDRDRDAALVRAVAQLSGEYALGVMFAKDLTSLYGARHKSPLVLAYNGSEAILTSDQAPILDLSNHVTYLEDGDIVHLRAGEVGITSLASGRSVHRTPVAHAASREAPTKGDYEHWMLKEIHEVPAVIEAALAIPYEELLAALPDPAFHLTLIGAGSSFYVARLGQYFFAKLAGHVVHALPADEALYWTAFGEHDAVIAISQSGETFDTLEVCRQAKESGVRLTSIANVPDCTQERMADYALAQGAGTEICVLSTKSVISQVAVLIRLASAFARHSGAITEADYQAQEAALWKTPARLQSVLNDLPALLRELAGRYAETEHWFFVGRGPLYPAALEAALKFKEVSYKHAEGLPAGFFKHGTISLIDEAFFTVALLPAASADHERLRATLANVSEIAARQGPVIGFGPDDLSADDRADFKEYVPLPLTGADGPDLLVHLLAGQLFAYYCALALGREIDQPRSLAKSVTVR